MSTYDLTSSIPSSSVLKTGDILNCPYSGSSKTITLPKGKYRLECWGAQGGYRSSSNYGGKGGYAKGTLTLTADTVIILVAGLKTTITRTVTLDTGAPVFQEISIIPNPVDAGKTYVISVKVTD